jgi:uncharacterized protein (DUF433 family)
VARDALLERISMDPEVCFGMPVVRGTRIWVGLILGLLADGATMSDLLDNYPQLIEDDIRACLAFASVLASRHYIEIG